MSLISTTSSFTFFTRLSLLFTQFLFFSFFFFNDTATTDIYTLSLHDALPIFNMLGTFVKDWFRYESHFVHGRDSLVDILKERGLLSESDAVQPLIGKKS